MSIFYNCIHWRVCALACPLDVKECRHFKAEGDEVKHGHWYWGSTCSVCKIENDYHKENDYRPYFCPNCGAKMDEGSEAE